MSERKQPTAKEKLDEFLNQQGAIEELERGISRRLRSRRSRDVQEVAETALSAALYDISKQAQDNYAFRDVRLVAAKAVFTSAMKEYRRQATKQRTLEKFGKLAAEREPQRGPLDECITAERASRVRRAFSLLDPDEQHLVLERYWCNRTLEDIAKRLFGSEARFQKVHKALIRVHEKLALTLGEGERNSVRGTFQ